jgi:Holliday junction resolvase-like predicted endonuclease
MNEQQIQTKILNYLQAKGFVTMKTIVTNRAGILDIIACSPQGKYWEIEVKTPEGLASRLQTLRVEKVRQNNGVSFIAYGFEDFLVKYNNTPII